MDTHCMLPYIQTLTHKQNTWQCQVLLMDNYNYSKSIKTWVKRVQNNFTVTVTSGGMGEEMIRKRYKEELQSYG